MALETGILGGEAQRCNFPCNLHKLHAKSSSDNREKINNEASRNKGDLMTSRVGI